MSVQNFNRAKYNQLWRDSQPLRQSRTNETPAEKQARELRGLRRALTDLEPLRFLPEIAKRIEELKIEISTFEAQLSSVVA